MTVTRVSSNTYNNCCQFGDSLLARLGLSTWGLSMVSRPCAMALFQQSKEVCSQY